MTPLICNISHNKFLISKCSISFSLDFPALEIELFFLPNHKELCLSIGNCTDPFATLYGNNSFLNPSIPDGAG